MVEPVVILLVISAERALESRSTNHSLRVVRVPPMLVNIDESVELRECVYEARSFKDRLGMVFH
jgi:hypothetical protein